MTNYINETAEEIFGIKADSSDAEKLRAYIKKKYGGENPQDIKKVFMSGEAAGFLTVNETYFFREPAHFELLACLLPDFEETGIRICSAATATGCEAYSIAMLLETYNKERVKPISYHIDAFDINQEAVNAASKGFYSERCMREDGSSFRYMAEPYLTKLGHGYQIDGFLKKNINFFTHNIMDAFSPDTYHLIFFRNAFIYFSQRARPQILSNLSCALKDKGLLIMGVSETAGVRHESLAERNTGDVFYFQKSARRTIRETGYLQN